MYLFSPIGFLARKEDIWLKNGTGGKAFTALLLYKSSICNRALKTFSFLCTYL